MVDLGVAINTDLVRHPVYGSIGIHHLVEKESGGLHIRMMVTNGL